MRQIDADSLIERLKPYKNKYGGESFPYDIAHDAFIYEIDQEPTIDAEPVRHGKWVKADRQQYFRKHYPASQCSICGWRKNYSGKYNYCPNCGAKME